MIELTFLPKSQSYDDLLAVGRAIRIWKDKQGSFVPTLENTAHLKFTEPSISVVTGVFDPADPESLPHSGIPNMEPMNVTANMKWTNRSGQPVIVEKDENFFIYQLCHELAHRLLQEHGVNPITSSSKQKEYEDHRRIYIFLFDTFLKAFGEDIYKLYVSYEIEKNNIGHDLTQYREAYEWAMSRSWEERQSLTQYLAENKRLPDSAVTPAP